MVEGKNEEMSTAELSGGARIHYIFQSIFVKSLEVCTLVVGVSFLLEWFVLIKCPKQQSVWGTWSALLIWCVVMFSSIFSDVPTLFFHFHW